MEKSTVRTLHACMLNHGGNSALTTRVLITQIDGLPFMADTCGVTNKSENGLLNSMLLVVVPMSSP